MNGFSGGDSGMMTPQAGQQPMSRRPLGLGLGLRPGQRQQFRQAAAGGGLNDFMAQHPHAAGVWDREQGDPMMAKRQAAYESPGYGTPSPWQPTGGGPLEGPGGMNRDMGYGEAVSQARQMAPGLQQAAQGLAPTANGAPPDTTGLMQGLQGAPGQEGPMQGPGGPGDVPRSMVPPGSLAGRQLPRFGAGGPGMQRVRGGMNLMANRGARQMRRGGR